MHRVKVFKNGKQIRVWQVTDKKATALGLQSFLQDVMFEEGDEFRIIVE